MNKQDEEKAKEIGRKFYFVGMNPNEAAYKAALQMATWKEQQMIEKFSQFLIDCCCDSLLYNEPNDVKELLKKYIEEN